LQIKFFTAILPGKADSSGGNMPIPAILYRLAVSFWLGGTALFTFVMTPIIFSSHDRDTAGKIVGTLFPGYFKWGLACGTVALLALLIVRGKYFTKNILILIVMLLLTAFQAFYLEPRAAALKREIPSFVTTSRNDPLRREFSRVHSVSAVCNVTVFGGGVLLIILL
jgi:hypothetical protein